ncbi:thioesterase II family protein [Phytohabitans kaempferiae]|uniref:Thioesterase II family protein n=1 Tax=Phytohabitans kaempferiae TaxID=1620943 RepID=A0ABV6M2V2_9ACTN
MTLIGEDVSPWIRQFHPSVDAPIRLVCFPHAGGSASYYFPVSRALAPSVDVAAVQYPGRQDRRGEPCVEDICELADVIALEMRPWCDRPLALFGHSMGATVAYEVGRRLERAGTMPMGIFASGRRAPSIDRNESIHLRDDRGVVQALQELSGTNSTLLSDDEFVSMVLPAVRADYKAVETYRHADGPVLACPVTALVGDTDPMATVEDAEAWRAHTTGTFRIKVYPGGHFYLTAQVDSVLNTIVDQLAEWTSGAR